MSVFFLKRGDTAPSLVVLLRDPPAPGSAIGPVHDLTGSTAWKLLISLSDGGVLIRTMTPLGGLTLGMLGYTWVATDWDPVSAGGTVGGLVVGPALPLAPGVVEHRMEYEVLGAGGARLTFPNDGYDTLRILPDLGQG